MITLKKRRVVFLTILFILSYCLHPLEGFASWDCFNNIHKEAISDAISISPTELKTILKTYEASMRKQVDYIQSQPPSNRKSYESYYKEIVELARQKDSNRYEYMGKMFTDLTIYAFSTYCPLKVSLCNDNEILIKTTVIFDGYDTGSDYRKCSGSYSHEEYGYTGRGQDFQMLEFYNLLVNEIVDMWATIWKDAGRDISGMPKVNTLVRGTVRSNEIKKEDVAGTSTRSRNLAGVRSEERTRENTGVYTDQDLRKFN